MRTTTSLNSFDLTPKFFHWLNNPSPEEIRRRQIVEDDCVKRFMLAYKNDVHIGALKFVDALEETGRIQFARKRTPYWFVTINPKPEITIETLHNRIILMLQQDDIEDPLWSYEIRQSPDKGLHAHILFTNHNANVNYAQRKVKALFVPEICSNKQHVHIKWISYDEIGTVESYIRKTHVAKSKKKSSDATNVWRAKLGISSEYSEDHLLVWSSLIHSIVPAICGGGGVNSDEEEGGGGATAPLPIILLN